MEWSLSPYTFEDDPSGDEDNSLAWTDALEDEYYAALAAQYATVPHYCPLCDAALQDDPPDPDTGIMRGVVYCETEGCPWPGQSY